MNLTNGEEIINFPIKRWDKYSNPTLDFMFAQGFVEVIPDPLTPEEIAANTLVEISNKIQLIELEIVTLANEKVNGHIDPSEKAHWMGVADALARKQALWVGDQFELTPDPVTYPPLSIDEKDLWAYLATIQKLTKVIRDVAKNIAIELYQMTNEDILVLPDDWVSTNILWP